MDAMTSVAGQLGIAAGFFVALLLTLRWVGKHFDKVREDANTERKEWQTKFDKANETAVRQLESNGNFQEEVHEAHNFQRDEHKEMILNLQNATQTLKSLNGNT